MQLASRYHVIMYSPKVNPCKVLVEAHKEFEEELFRQQVEIYKEDLRSKWRTKQWWHRFIPFTIKIERRNNV